MNYFYRLLLLFIGEFLTKLSAEEPWSEMDDFKRLVRSGAPIADKTLLIKEIMNSDRQAILFTRPKKFGKTVNLSMLYHFLSMNESSADLFQNLKISKDRAFFGANINKHPTLYLSFQFSDPTSKQKIKNHNFQWAMYELYKKHFYIRATIKEELDLEYFDCILNRSAIEQPTEIALWELTRHLYRVFNRTVIVLIDGCDTRVEHGYYYNFYNSMRNALTNVLQSASHDLFFRVKIIVTGITNVPLEVKHIDPGNIYTVLHSKYSEYFGLTDVDVENMLRHPKVSLTLNATVLRSWYGGYTIGDHSLFNPWSVQRCLENKGVLKQYLTNDPHSEFTSLVTDHGILPLIESELMLMDVNVTTTLSKTLDYQHIYSNANVYYHSLMVFQGYFIVRGLIGDENTYNLKIPNLEMKGIFKAALENYPKKYKIKRYDDFMKDVEEKNEVAVADSLTNYLKIGRDIFTYKESIQYIPQIFRGLEKNHGRMASLEVQKTFCVKFGPANETSSVVLLGVEKIQSLQTKNYSEDILSKCIKAYNISGKYPNLLKFSILVSNKIHAHFLS